MNSIFIITYLLLIYCAIQFNNHNINAQSIDDHEYTIEMKNQSPSYISNQTDIQSIAGQAGTKTERSFLAVKPDGVQRSLVGDIIKRFEQKGYKLVGLKLIQATKAQAEAHYAEHKGKPFFNGLVEFFISGPLVAMVWEGIDIIASGRKMMGATKPKDSAPGTIRGDFGVCMGRNIIHGSDGPESAAKEIATWFKPEEIVNWSPANIKWLME